jgi:hypothetical protein
MIVLLLQNIPFFIQHSKQGGKKSIYSPFLGCKHNTKEARGFLFSLPRVPSRAKALVRSILFFFFAKESACGSNKYTHSPCAHGVCVLSAAGASSNRCNALERPAPDTR